MTILRERHPFEGRLLVVMSAIKRRGTLFLLVVLPDGSRSQVGQIGQGLLTTVRYRGVNITILASHRWQICSTPEGSWTLSSVAA